MDCLDCLDRTSDGAAFSSPRIDESLGLPGPALLAEASAAGITLWVAAGIVKAEPSPPADLLARLRAHKLELAELLQGDRCRYCSGPVRWAEPNVLVFADRMAAHLGCYEQAETLRQSTPPACRSGTPALVGDQRGCPDGRCAPQEREEASGLYQPALCRWRPSWRPGAALRDASPRPESMTDA